MFWDGVKQVKRKKTKHGWREFINKRRRMWTQVQVNNKFRKSLIMQLEFIWRKVQGKRCYAEKGRNTWMHVCIYIFCSVENTGDKQEAIPSSNNVLWPENQLIHTIRWNIRMYCMYACMCVYGTNTHSKWIGYISRYSAHRLVVMCLRKMTCDT